MIVSDLLLQAAEDIVYGVVLFTAIYFGFLLAMRTDRKALRKAHRQEMVKDLKGVKEVVAYRGNGPADRS